MGESPCARRPERPTLAACESTSLSPRLVMHTLRRISSRWILPSVLTFLAVPGAAQETTALDLPGLETRVPEDVAEDVPGQVAEEHDRRGEYDRSPEGGQLVGVSVDHSGYDRGQGENQADDDVPAATDLVVAVS